jgi:hypothetical protein
MITSVEGGRFSSKSPPRAFPTGLHGLNQAVLGRSGTVGNSVEFTLGVPILRARRVKFYADPPGSCCFGSTSPLQSVQSDSFAYSNRLEWADENESSVPLGKDRAESDHCESVGRTVNFAPGWMNRSLITLFYQQLKKGNPPCFRLFLSRCFQRLRAALPRRLAPRRRRRALWPLRVRPLPLAARRGCGCRG